MSPIDDTPPPVCSREFYLEFGSPGENKLVLEEVFLPVGIPGLYFDIGEEAFPPLLN